MKNVYLLWQSDHEGKLVVGIYADKTQAEAQMRLMKDENESDARGGWYDYWVQERTVK
jgi:hypothetical protein